MHAGEDCRGRPRTAWMDNIKTWTGLSVDDSIRMTEDGINGENTSMVWPTLGSRTAKEQNRTPCGTDGQTKGNERRLATHSTRQQHVTITPDTRPSDRLDHNIYTHGTDGQTDGSRHCLMPPLYHHNGGGRGIITGRGLPLHCWSPLQECQRYRVI